MNRFVEGGAGVYWDLLRTEMTGRIQAVEVQIEAAATDETKSHLKVEAQRILAEYEKKLLDLQYCLF